jgi:hypothetical protein
MTARILKDVLERVESWPEEAQTELAQIALKAGDVSGSPMTLNGFEQVLARVVNVDPQCLVVLHGAKNDASSEGSSTRVVRGSI